MVRNSSSSLGVTIARLTDDGQCGSSSAPEVLLESTTRSGVFQPKVVVDRVAEFLLAAKISLGRLNRRMPQQKLNLLKLTSRQMAQSHASPALMP